MADPQKLASTVVNEKVALKLKAYFDLAKEEIDKALSCEQWGLQDDAILFYQHALKMLIEAKGTCVPDAISSSEKSQVKSCQQKIAKWQAHLEDRLKLLGTTNKQKLAKWQADFEDKLKLLAQKTGTPPPPFTTTSKEKTSSLSSETERIVLPTNYNNNNNNNTNNTTTNNSNNNTTNTTTNNNNNKDQGGVVNKIITGAVKLASSSTIAVAQDTLREMINATIVDRSPAVSWDDVAGLDKAKQALMEMVILPTKRRDLFTGLRKPAKGLLLFGPPGNGKTMLAKAVASESDATFFNVSASSLTSKWVGEGEKLVRTLFEAAVARQPSVIFIDEIDSVMSTRQAYEHDSSRRLKSEFLIQFDGVTSSQDALVIVIGATNKPQELDDAVLRRLVKRIYVPLPDATLRKILFKNQLKGQSNLLSGVYLERLVTETEGYSGSDMRALCEEAAMIPIRELGPQNILTIKVNQLRALKYEDFKKAMVVIRPSLQKSKWDDLDKWNKKFGSN